MKYFISDTHFGHNAEFIYGSRGFNSMKEHDITILNRINERVQENDELYLLGDFALGNDIDYVRRCLEEIVCTNIHLILGNHDSPRKIEEVYSQCDKIVEICHATLVKISKRKYFYLSHFPMVMDSNDKQHSHYINLFGHTHQSCPPFYYMNNEFNWHMINVGVDCHHTVVSEEEILEFIRFRGKYI